MTPKALLEVCTALMRDVLLFELPADVVVSTFFRRNKALGVRERHTLAETVYDVLRRRLLYQHLSQRGPGAPERRMAILGWAGDALFLKAALTPEEQKWLAQAREVDVATLAPKLRHNLPDWIAQPLQSQLGEEGFWALGPFGEDSLSFSPHPTRTSRAEATFRLACPTLEELDGEPSSCRGTVTLREAGGARRLLGRGRVPDAGTRDTFAVRVALTPLGRRRASRPRGVAATAAIQGRNLPHVRWTIPLRVRR